MSQHAERAHATWSASSTARNWNCPGSLVLTQQVAHLEEESEAAAWGTACHEVAEWCLREGREAIEATGRIIKTKEHDIEVDEEIAETAQEYINYVRKRAGVGSDVKLMIEQRFSLDKLKPPFDAGGTGDAILYFPSERLLEVVDLKGGRGVRVEVFENKQLRTYALGAVLANPGIKIDRVRSTIVQPRMSHKDGRIRFEEYDIIDLMEWTSDLVAAMNKSAAASKAYAAITGDISREEWSAKYLTPGDHCDNNFCAARGFCPARKKQALDAAGVWFDDLNRPQLSNTPADLDVDQLAKLLDAADMIENYLGAARSLAKSLAESGTEVPNYILVEKIGRRKWKVDEAALRKELFVRADLTDEIYERKLKSPAQLEKVLGSKRKALIEDLVEKPVTGTNLVRADKTDREAVPPSALRHFSNIE
jgi:hypothetical protein